MLCTVYQPGGFRPFNISVFKAELGKFRKKWAFYDFLVSACVSPLCLASQRLLLTIVSTAQNAEGVTGQYDGCLVSLHKPQRIGKTVGEDLKDGSCERMVRLVSPSLSAPHPDSRL
jgi:distribution and morphology protein 31